MKNSNNTNNYYKPKQLKLTLEIEKINLIFVVLTQRVVDKGHSIKFKNRYYIFINCNGYPIYFGYGTKLIVIESFNK